jgi:hypothetical protein
MGVIHPWVIINNRQQKKPEISAKSFVFTPKNQIIAEGLNLSTWIVKRKNLLGTPAQFRQIIRAKLAHPHTMAKSTANKGKTESLAAIKRLAATARVPPMS